MSVPIRPVDLAKAYRLLNHGPTVLVSARHQAVDNVMAAAWCCALDFDPPKLTLVLDKATRTRALIEGSGLFAIQIPTVAQLQLTQAVGNTSLADEPAKLARAGVELFEMDGHDLPLAAQALDDRQLLQRLGAREHRGAGDGGVERGPCQPP